MHQHACNRGHESPVTRGFQWKASGYLHWELLWLCISLSQHGSENCLISHQLSRQTVEASSFCCSQAAPPHGLPSAAGSQDTHPRVLAGAESSWAPWVQALHEAYGGFKPPALGVMADSCSLSFWNNQLKPVLFLASRAEKRMEFPFRETFLSAFLGNRVNFPKIFPPKAEISVSTSSNYETIPFLSDNQIWDLSFPSASPFTIFFCSP